MHSNVRAMIVVSCVISVALLSKCGGGSAQQVTQRLTITTAALPNGTSETPYSQTLQANGGVGPFTWTVSAGALPHNVALGNSTTRTNTISGTPDTAAQGQAFTVQVMDSASHAASQAYTVSILLEPDTLILSPTNLSLAQLLGTPSAAQPETVTNTGTTAVVISNIAVTGTNGADFGQTNTCGSSLAAGTNCTINIIFTPSQLGPSSAAVTVTDNTVGSPHSASLSGTGLTAGANASLSASSLPFSTQLVNTTSPPKGFILNNYGTVTLNITSVDATSNFGESDNCGSSLASGASCIINVTFTPSASGSLNGTLSITDNALGSPQTVTLSGTGTTTSYTLTGYCAQFVRSNPGACSPNSDLDLTQCPAGQPATSTTLASCGPAGAQVRVDTSRSCGSFFLGECVAQ